MVGVSRDTFLTNRTTIGANDVHRVTLQNKILHHGHDANTGYEVAGPSFAQ
ncbi:hypothetical protein TorRG33x02_348880, partial [Trema orientale]